MRGDLLDLVLLGLVIASALAGYRRGLICGVASFVGVVLGALLGAWLGPILVQHLGSLGGTTAGSDQALGRRVVLLVVVLVFAGVGDAVGTRLGFRLRSRLPRRAEPVDGAGGAVLSGLSVLVVAWLVASALASSPITGVASQIHRSLVLRTVDGAMPGSAQQAASRFLREMQRHGLPAVSGPFQTLLAPAVRAPDPAVVPGAARAAAGSIVKITGAAPSCERSLEGSGFVYAPSRVMTNAHVVAGVRDPVVQVPRGPNLPARVVVYDPDRDVAVLAVPGLDRPALAFTGPAAPGAPAVVAGYPEDGPFSAVAARIAGRGEISGPNIYQTGDVTREVYTVRAQVRPGNSGGPLLDASGRVDGVVFAASVVQKDVGFALTAAEVRADATAGRAASATVSTQGCD